jgi:hypothetical protein
VIFRALRFLLCRLEDGLCKGVCDGGAACPATLLLFLSFFFSLILLPRVELTLRDLAHLFAFGFPFLAVDVGKIFGLTIALAQEVNVALALYALRVDFGLVADPHERGGVLIRVPVMPAELTRRAWCGWSESNRHSLRNTILSRARLPVPPHPLCHPL